MDKMLMDKSYVITYENGATHFIQSDNIENAIKESRIALLQCMPKGFDPNNLVRAVKAERIKDFADFDRYRKSLDPT